MKRFSVYLKLSADATFSHSYVTAPTAIAAVQAQMLVQKVRFAHHALAFESDKNGEGESATLTDFVYVPARPTRKVVR